MRLYTAELRHQVDRKMGDFKTYLEEVPIHFYKKKYITLCVCVCVCVRERERERERENVWL